MKKKHINNANNYFHHKAKSCSIISTSFSDKNQPDKLKFNANLDCLGQITPLLGVQLLYNCLTVL